jgi:tetratricopeptide (TPR) repeat protein
MPRRRTTDVVNTVMTDHKIARHKPTGDPLASRNEIHDTDATAYKGEVALLYPRTVTTPLYLDLAQVIDGANLKAGIPRLEWSIAQLQPKEAGFYFELANAYVQAGQNEKAFRWYEEALRREPELLPAQVKYAAALTAAGRHGDAIRLLEPAPPDSTALNTLGSAYLNAGRMADAISTFRRAIDSDIPEIYVNLGAALSRKGDRAGAIDAMRTAIRLAPDFAAAHNNLGNLLGEEGDFPKAFQAFQTALRLNPAYAEAHYNFGRSLAAANSLEAAETEFRAALKLNPNLAEAAISRGLVLARQGRLDEAISQYRETLRRNTTLLPARFNLSLALMRQGKNALAKEQFETILNSTPNDYETHYHLGMILLAEGATQAAKSHLQKALASPNLELRRAAQKAIGSAFRK